MLSAHQSAHVVKIETNISLEINQDIYCISVIGRTTLLLALFLFFSVFPFFVRFLSIRIEQVRKLVHVERARIWMPAFFQPYEEAFCFAFVFVERTESCIGHTVEERRSVIV